LILRRTSALLLVGVGTICGCAYFNGLYNANQLAKDAIRAEREGRVGEARSLWSQAAVKAESVAVRYTESRYHDDALLMQGRALRAAGRCESAIEPLQLVIGTSSDKALVEFAHYFLGRCLLSFGRVDSAIASFSRTLPSDDTLLASAAHLWRGRAYADIGVYAAAVVDFRASSLVDAAFDLAVAHVRLEQIVDAGRVLRWRADGQYQEPLWLATLDSVGESAPDLAATIVDALLERPGLSAVERGNLLLQDGDRWAARGDAERSMARYESVLAVAPGTAVGDASRFRRIVAELQSSVVLERLPAWLDSLSGMTDVAAPALPPVAELTDAVEAAVASLQNSSDGDDPSEAWRRSNPDLDMFLAAESLRDRARADLLSAALFEEVASRYPRSPVAPKALLAAAALHPRVADSLVAIVRRKYPRSPYTLVLNGFANEAYAVLEDSLRTLILARRGAT
jgi:tetratricopeptide (TPR) repeat protein